MIQTEKENKSEGVARERKGEWDEESEKEKARVRGTERKSKRKCFRRKLSEMEKERWSSDGESEIKILREW